MTESYSEPCDLCTVDAYPSSSISMSSLPNSLHRPSPKSTYKSVSSPSWSIAFIYPMSPLLISPLFLFAITLSPTRKCFFPVSNSFFDADGGFTKLRKASFKALTHVSVFCRNGESNATRSTPYFFTSRKYCSSISFADSVRSAESINRKSVPYSRLRFP